MAGAGFKDFAVGEVLTASDVDTYLMQQSVMRFATSAARGSALGTAVGTAVPLAEGMVTYLDDVNAMQVYTGTGWTTPMSGIGANVVVATHTGTTSTTSTSYQNTSITATITPTSSSSKVLVLVNFGSVRSAAQAYTALYRTNVSGTQLADITTRTTFDADSRRAPGSILYLDSPVTTSAQTYMVGLRSDFAGAIAEISGFQTMILIEVAA